MPLHWLGKPLVVRTRRARIQDDRAEESSKISMNSEGRLLLAQVHVGTFIEDSNMILHIFLFRNAAQLSSGMFEYDASAVCNNNE